MAANDTGDAMALNRIYLLWILVTSLCFGTSALAADPKTEVLTTELDHPWSLAFLPEGDMLVTERPGYLRLIIDGKLHPAPISGLPEIEEKGQGGLLDVALHPDFEKNGWVYLSYAAPGTGGLSTHIGRGKLKDHELHDWQKLFELRPRSRGGRHFGSRMAFSPDGMLYISIGERGDTDRAQKLDDAAGSILRIHDDGRIPEDNPFVGTQGAIPQIYSYGHRNPQGMAFHPDTGELWTHEHGPQGGDEINIIKAAVNYGWPVITYGCQYVICTQIGEGTAKAGMEQPLHYWVPSIAPSGMAFHQGHLYVGSLKFQRLHRLTLDGQKVIKEEKLFEDRFGRIRDVRSGPDGHLYLLTDDGDGKLIRIRLP